ncbi:MAG: PEP-utilizing enzyme [Actinomycetota bacterium]|nr:PEP-utilizing enzyme [Actinomycetota bacterium]
METWITDTEISPRFSAYTRANADEVGPMPFSPLGWSLGWMKACIPGVAGGFIAFGVLEEDEFALDPPEVFGNWGGYFYNQLALPRLMGCRMPGASPEAIDQAYFGDHPGVPPYVPHPEDENAEAEAKLAETMAWAMSTDGYPAMDDAAAMARRVVSERPDLGSLSNADLVSRARSMAPLIVEAWIPYCQVCLAASLGPGAVQAICAGIGRPEDAVKLMVAIGGVESAEASFAMWDLSRIISGDEDLMAAFELGVDGLAGRLEVMNTPTAAAFVSGWKALIEEHGHRGPNEWDMRPHSWFTDPTITLSMLERLRHQDDSRSPHEAKNTAATERVALATEVLAAVEGDAETHGTLQAGLHSTALFFGLRERGKNACIRLIHEAKLAFLELGSRMTSEGVIDDSQDLFMLLDEELDDFLTNPTDFTATIAERSGEFARLHELQPPYIITIEDGVPPISQWGPRDYLPVGPVTTGDVLQGAPGAPGVVTGTARVVLDPADPSSIQPGDIMVAPTTDPSWTPLFLSAAGVVVNVGAVASHAAIVCRELGVPCAVSVVDATRRIPDGSTITIDGSTGTVSVDSTV